MRRRTLLAFGLLLLASGPVLAAEAAPEVARIKTAVKKGADGFLTVKYGGYIIKTDADEQFAAEAAAYMRKFYEAFRSFFKPKPKLKATPVVYLFKDRLMYQAFMKKRGYEALVKAGGAYSGGRGRSELFCWHSRPGAGFAAFPKRVLRHEGAHQLLSYILGTHRIPIWYNEGVATFFEGWQVEKPRKWNLETLQHTHTRFALIRRIYGTKDFQDLHHLMGLSHETWVPDDFGQKTRVHYAEVESFMTFLLVNKKGRKFFSIIFKAVAKGKDPAAMMSRKVIDSAQKAWYKDIEARIERLKKGHIETKKTVPFKPAAGRY